MSQSFVGNVLLRLDLMQKAAPNDGSYSKFFLVNRSPPERWVYHPTVLGAYEKLRLGVGMPGELVEVGLLSLAAFRGATGRS